MNRHTTFLSFVVANVALGFGLVFSHEGHQPLPTKGVQVDVQKGEVTLSAQARATIGLQTGEVVTGQVASTLKVYAESVSPWHAKAFGSAKISGRITKLLVRPGDSVAKDEIVAELDSRELELIRFDYLQAKNELALNQKLLEITRPTAQAGAIPMARLLDIENAVEQSRNRLELARLKARTLGVSIEDFPVESTNPLLHPIRAPIAGRILHSDLAEGKYVEAFEHLFEIVNTEEVWVRLQLLEKDSFNIRIGDRAVIEFLGNSQTMEGVIDRMDPILDPTTHTSSAWVKLAGASMIPGLVGNATILNEEQSEKITVPQRAVFSDGLQNYVFVEEASTRLAAEYRKKPIKLGKRIAVASETNESMIEVVHGDIFPGDRVVVQGGHELSSLFFLGVLKLSPTEQQRLGILTQSAIQRELSETIQLPALVTSPPENRSVLSSQLNGTVQKHALSPGRTVQKGETLIEIASPEFLQLQIDLISTTLNVELYRRRADRLEGIKGDTVALRNVLEARSQAEQMELKSESLRRQLITFGLLDSEIDSIVQDRQILDYLPVRSSIEGRVAGLAITVGEAVTANQPLVEVQNLSSVWIEAYIPSNGSIPVSSNMNAIATVVAKPDLKLPVLVSRIGPTIDASTRTQRIWLLPKETPEPIENSPQLRIGTLMTVELPIGRPKTTLAIPSSSILRDGMHYFSFVRQDDGFMERRRIKIGRSDGLYTEVLEGMNFGEQVVTVGSRELQTAFASLR